MVGSNEYIVYSRVRVRKERNMKTEFKYNSYGTEYRIFFRKSQYQNNGALAVQAYCEDAEGFVEPFCTVTVNLPRKPSAENRAWIDVNNVPQDFIEMLIKEGIINFTSATQSSGFVLYLEAEFNEEWLNSL